MAEIVLAAVDGGANHPDLMNSLVLLVVAVLQGVAMWVAKRNHQISHRKLSEVKQAASEIKHSVDGPLGQALAVAANALEALATRTEHPEDILKAVAARKLFDDHERTHSAALLAAKKSDEEKAAIIAEFLEKKGRT